MEEQRNNSVRRLPRRGVIYRLKHLSKIYNKQAPIGGMKRAVFLALPFLAATLMVSVVVAQVVSRGQNESVTFTSSSIPVVTADKINSLDLSAIDMSFSRNLNIGAGVEKDGAISGEIQGQLGVEAVLATSAQDLWITENDINLRKTADANGEIQGTMMAGDKVSGVIAVGEYSKITTAAKLEGFVATKFLSSKLVEVPFAAKDAKVWVKVDVANVREKADVAATVVTQVVYGDQINQVATNGTWSEVKTSDGKKGFMKNELFQSDAIVKWIDKTLYVRVDVVNVREKASTASTVVTQINYADKVTQVGEAKDSDGGNWAEVKTASGKRGYVLGSLLQADAISKPVTPAPSPTTPAISGNAAAAADLALTFLGLPYVWGGASPKGFDCSGLIYYCYRQNGIYLPRTADAQGDAITRISQSELKKGDLCFFGSYGSRASVGHVGIYVGNGKFVHSPDEGDVVKITPLGGYYEAMFFGRTKGG